MYNYNKAHQSKNRVHISWDLLYHVTKATKLTVELFYATSMQVYAGAIWTQSVGYVLY